MVDNSYFARSCDHIKKLCPSVIDPVHDFFF